MRREKEIGDGGGRSGERLGGRLGTEEVDVWR